MTKGVIYARVSSEEQAKTGYSIQAQYKSVRGKFLTDHVERVHSFEEVHSAKEEGRPVFQEMIQFLVDHPDVRVVGVDKQDRLSRNHIDLGIIRDRLGCRILSVKDPVDDTPAGYLQQDIRLAIDAHYSRNLAQEVRKGLRAKFESGGMVSKAPVGYRNIPRTRTEHGRVEIDVDRAPAIRWMFEEYARGTLSLCNASAALFDQGIRTLSARPYSPEMVRHILANSSYMGLVRYQGETRPGSHPAIVSSELFNEVQRVLVRRGQDSGEKGTKFFLLRGLVACGRCGRRMTAEEHLRGSYYRCLPDPLGVPCTSRYSPVSELDRAVEALLPSIRLTENAKADTLNALRSIESERTTMRGQEVDDLRGRHERVARKLTKLTDAFAGGEVPEASYHELCRAYQQELSGVNERLAFLDADLTSDIAAVSTLLDTASAVDRLYRLASTPAERKDHLRALFARIEVVDRVIMKIEYRPPFHLFLGTPAAAGSGVSRAVLDYIASNR